MAGVAELFESRIFTPQHPPLHVIRHPDPICAGFVKLELPKFFSGVF